MRSLFTALTKQPASFTARSLYTNIEATREIIKSVSAIERKFNQLKTLNCVEKFGNGHTTFESIEAERIFDEAIENVKNAKSEKINAETLLKFTRAVNSLLDNETLKASIAALPYDKLGEKPVKPISGIPENNRYLNGFDAIKSNLSILNEYAKAFNQQKYTHQRGRN
jgi:hypothetical protein